MRENGIITAQYMQELINNNEELHKYEKCNISVINFDEYLQFLNLDKKGGILYKVEVNIKLTLKTTIKLGIEAIKSSSSLEKLTQLAEKYIKFLYY